MDRAPNNTKFTDQVHDLANKEEPLEKDDTFPDHFQFSWDFLNTDKIDAPDDRAILDEIEFTHEEADEETSHAPTVESNENIEENQDDNDDEPPVEIQENQGAQEAQLLEQEEAQEVPPANNDHQGAQEAIPTNTTNQGAQGALPIIKVESSEEEDSISEQE